MSAHNRLGAVLRRQAPELVVGLCLIAAPFVLPGLHIDADLLTPPSIVEVLRRGYAPLWHATGAL